MGLNNKTQHPHQDRKGRGVVKWHKQAHASIPSQFYNMHLILPYVSHCSNTEIIFNDQNVQLFV